MRKSRAILPIILALGMTPAANSQKVQAVAPELALSCTMESPEQYRNHVVAVTVSEKRKAATVQGRPAKEVIIEYLRFVIIEDKIRWAIDRGTGRLSMFQTGSGTPELYGQGACQAITKRKF
jgi:hypothetical protein